MTDTLLWWNDWFTSMVEWLIHFYGGMIDSLLGWNDWFTSRVEWLIHFYGGMIDSLLWWNELKFHFFYLLSLTTYVLVHFVIFSNIFLIENISLKQLLLQYSSANEECLWLDIHVNMPLTWYTCQYVSWLIYMST